MKKQTKIFLIITLIIILIILAILFLIINKSITGNIIKDQENSDNSDTYTYTKAICNSTNFCQDNEITCKSNETISISPITGAVIQHSEDWQDPRR